MKFSLLFVDDVQEDIDDFEEICKEHFSGQFNIDTLCCPDDCPEPVRKKLQRKLSERLKNDNPVDLLILDYNFDRLDDRTIEAREILERLRDGDIYYRKLPVIVLTDLDSFDLSADLLRLWQPLDFTTKSIFKSRPHELKEKIFNLLLTVARYFVECLQKQRVKHVYGISGTEVLEIIHAIQETQEDRIEYILTGHEQGAAFMANGAGRVNNERVPGVCLATLGPGATNLMTGIADAYEDKSSVVVITGQAPSRRLGKESHQAENTLDMFTPFTKYRKKIESTDAIEISSAVAKAFDIARGENPGPVLLEIPNDIAESIVTNYVPPVAPFEKPNIPQSGDIVILPTASSDMLAEAVSRIMDAERPIILAGSGANRAAQNATGNDNTIHNILTTLVDKFHIPVTTTFMGKGSVSYKNPLCLPVVGCRQSKDDYDLANIALDAADLVITVGYDFFEFESDIWNFYRGGLDEESPEKAEKTNIINISFTPPQIDYCYNPDLILLGSIAANLQWICDELSDRSYKGPKPYWSKTLPEKLRGMHSDEFEKYLTTSSSKLTPHQVVHTIRQNLGADGILVSDGGFNKMVTARFYKAYLPNTCLIPNGFSTVGYGVPVAVGVKVEHPEKSVVATVGDGGFIINGQELATAVHHKRNIVVVVLKDGYHGLIKIKNENKYPIGIDKVVRLPNINYAKMARSMGALGKSVGNVQELEEALKIALEDADRNGRSTLIEACVSYDGIKFDKIEPNCKPKDRLEKRKHTIGGGIPGVST